MKETFWEKRAQSLENITSERGIQLRMNRSIQVCDGLGITLAQFFEEESDTAHLSAEQQHLLNRWDQLSEKEKQAVGNMIDIILQLHK